MLRFTLSLCSSIASLHGLSVKDIQIFIWLYGQNASLIDDTCHKQKVPVICYWMVCLFIGVCSSGLGGEVGPSIEVHSKQDEKPSNAFLWLHIGHLIFANQVRDKTTIQGLFMHATVSRGRTTWKSSSFHMRKFRESFLSSLMRTALGSYSRFRHIKLKVM